MLTTRNFSQVGAMRILFCGNTFPAAPELLRPRLPREVDKILIWQDGDLATVPPAEVVIPLMSRVDAAVMERARPQLIQQWGAGLDGVDLVAARARGIRVASVPASGGNAQSVAEHAILLMLTLLRKFPETQESIRRGVLGMPLGLALAGRTVCLWGLGAIALPLAQMLRGFQVRVLGITRDPQSAKAAAFQLDECFATAERERALGQSDILVVCVRLTPETERLIGVRELAALPQGAYVVNVARGGLIDYDALVEALRSKHLAGAGLDVFWHEPIAPDDPILALPNVVATPHIAGITDHSYREIAEAVVGNIERLRRGEEPANCAV